MRHAVGVDLGGTKIRVALVEERGGIASDSVFPTGDADQPERVMEGIAEGVRRVAGKAGVALADIQGIGMGCAGQISPDGRRVLFSPNLDWHDVPLADILEEKLGRPVTVENDVRAAALGEAFLGAGKGVEDLVCIFVGTGVGSGIMTGGRLLRGARNLAGEVGHIKLDPEGPACTCGGNGCLEVYAGGGHVERRLREAIRHGESTRLSEADGLSVTAVERAARQGDRLAGRFWDEVVWALGLGISNLITIFNPEKVILGGGVVEGTPVIVKKVKEAVPKLATMLSGKQVEIVRARLGNRAGAIGASRLFP